MEELVFQVVAEEVVLHQLQVEQEHQARVMLEALALQLQEVAAAA